MATNTNAIAMAGGRVLRIIRLEPLRQSILLLLIIPPDPPPPNHPQNPHPTPRTPPTPHAFPNPDLLSRSAASSKWRAFWTYSLDHSQIGGWGLIACLSPVPGQRYSMYPVDPALASPSVILWLRLRAGYER